ncbi:hypothetical protein ABKW28_22175 [Nocardioides sp. 31GB23]|uniref:hypothetical protein n=1 Tax=Nocardioides sp. 31GB23 TaxID=3156065 RepID=UPI0032AF796C
MQRKALGRRLALAVVLVPAGGLGVAVTAGAYLSWDITERCLRADPPRTTDESQAVVTASADYLRGRLQCRWSNENGSKVDVETFPLYTRA